MDTAHLFLLLGMVDKFSSTQDSAYFSQQPRQQPGPSSSQTRRSSQLGQQPGPSSSQPRRSSQPRPSSQLSFRPSVVPEPPPPPPETPLPSAVNPQRSEIPSWTALINAAVGVPRTLAAAISPPPVRARLNRPANLVVPVIDLTGPGGEESDSDSFTDDSDYLDIDNFTPPLARNEIRWDSARDAEGSTVENTPTPESPSARFYRSATPAATPRRPLRHEQRAEMLEERRNLRHLRTAIRRGEDATRYQRQQYKALQEVRQRLFTHNPQQAVPGTLRTLCE